MARGRAPSHNAYRGSLGQTRTALVHVTGPSGDLVAAQVYTTIDVLADPALLERLHSDDPAIGLNLVRFEDGAIVRAPVAVVYHDPEAEIMVLVLGDAHRHRELDERIALYGRLLTDDSPIPAYVKNFGVVFGAQGLHAYLERRTREGLDIARVQDANRDADRRRADVSAREVDVDRRARELERRTMELEVAKAELATRTAELANRTAELDRNRAELERSRSEARARVIAAVQQMPVEAPAEKTTVVERPVLAAVAPRAESSSDLQTRPLAFSDLDAPHDDDIVTSANNVALMARLESDNFEGLATGITTMPRLNGEGPSVEFDEETTSSSNIPSGSDPLTTETSERTMDGGPDAWLADAMREPVSSFLVQGGRVRLALVADEAVARTLGGNLDVRVLLYRTPDAPVIAFAIGSPAALRVATARQLVVLTLDIATKADRHILDALAKKFVLDVDIVTRGRQIRHVELTGPLTDNVGYIVRAADDHLRGVAADGVPSFERACQRVLSPTFDLLGVEHSDAPEFRDDKLAGLETASHLRRAIAVARRFARPSREDYLVCTRGFPLPRWRELRRHVLESAVAWGLWMGPELAQVAVSEGLARSRRDLVVRLEQGFEALRRHPTAFDLDADAAADNASALAEEARALGVELTARKPAAGPASKPTTSEEAPVASGSIPGTPAHGIPQIAKAIAAAKSRATSEPKAPAIAILNTPKAVRATDELIGMLESREHRLSAAIELCDRGVGTAASKIIDAVNKMSRADAVRVLGMSVKLGEAAKQPLIDGLASSKAYLRHGCALALAMLRTEDGTQAVIDLLLAEPTEIWREVARAVGQVGPTALMPLASNFGRLGDRGTPVIAERVAWAMAHVGVRGGKGAIETMAGGQSVVAPVARKALELVTMAARDEVRVRPDDAPQPGRDVTVNRAFSRRFFESLEQGVPEEGQAGLSALDASSQMEMLDEADLIEDDIEEAELDESDLIQH